ncbi:glycosyltransferase family 4 protein [Albirhodobacter sp. R86504]|uniref:glycosyltransferase family 4 protein n=1 Tax=Albirhodobacter sp. R86504 TaxID=3093848 RepID=UPI00367166F2
MSAPLPRVFFLDQSGDLGGAELSLLDIVGQYRGEKRVCLLSDGPFAAKLRAAGHDVQMLPLTSGVRRGSGVAEMLRSLPHLARVIAGIGRSARAFDVVYANTMKALVLAALSRPLHRRPVIWHIRDILSADHFSPLALKVARSAANLGTDRQIANSEATAAAFRAAGGHQEAVVIHNAIPTGAFHPQNRASLRTVLVQETGLDPANPIIGVFGRLAEWKGQHIVIEAISKICGCQLAIVGGALFGENAAEARLRQKVADLGLSERVRFLGFRDDVPALMGGVDIVVHSSIQPEPFGRVIVEAMLAGTPVIATRAGGAIEIVTDDATGLLVAPGDVDALAQAIARLIADPNLQQQFSEAALIDAKARFSPEICFPRIDSVICSVAGQQPPPSSAGR